MVTQPDALPRSILTACSFLNNSKISTKEKALAEEFIPSAWLTLFKQQPIFIMSTHAKRNAYLLPIPIYGIPKAPFLHSTIEFKDQGIKWAFSSIAEKARALMRAWNAIRGLTAWAGLWCLVMLALLVFGRRMNLAPVIAMSISMIGMVLECK